MPNVKLHRYENDAWQELNPKTTIGQVENLSDELDEKLDADEVGSAGGVAPLDSNAKVPLNHLPETAITGMSWQGTHAQQDLPTIDDFLEDAGNFWIVNDDVGIQFGEDEWFKTEDGELVNNTVRGFQSGDWLIFIGEHKENDGEGVWSVVNNNQTNRFLALGGGTMSGEIDMNENNIDMNGGRVTGFDVLQFKDGELEAVEFDIFYRDNKIWHEGNDGSGSGLDADQLDGQHGSFYRNASNLNDGTVPSGRLSGSYDISITGVADQAEKLRNERTISLNGDVSGSINFDGSSDVSMSVSVEDNSHEHNGDTVELNDQPHSYYFASEQGFSLDRFLDVHFRNSMDNKNSTYYGGTEPSSSSHDPVLEGDLWFETE